jgi:hypothetical protein
VEDAVKNITLSADEYLIERARDKARQENRSLNDAFREWLADWTGSGEDRVARFREMMEVLSTHIQSDRSYTRDEMNER